MTPRKDRINPSSINGRNYLVAQVLSGLLKPEWSYELYVDSLDNERLASGKTLVDLADDACRNGMFMSSPNDLVLTIPLAHIKDRGLKGYGPLELEDLYEFVNEWRNHAHLGDIERDQIERSAKK